MSNDNAPPKMSAAKAHTAGAATSGAILILGLLGDKLGLPAPPIEDVGQAALIVLEAAIGGAIAWAGTWRVANKPKE